MATAIVPVRDISTAMNVVTYGLRLWNVYVRNGGEEVIMYLATDTDDVYVATYSDVTRPIRGIVACNIPFNLRVVNYRVSTSSIYYDTGIIVVNSDEAEVERYSALLNTNSGDTLNIAYVEPFPDAVAAKTAIQSVVPPIAQPITYRLINCTAPGAPAEAAPGSTVNVNLSFTEGFGVANPADAYVMNNGVLIPSTLTGNVLTFTMP